MYIMNSYCLVGDYAHGKYYTKGSVQMYIKWFLSSCLYSAMSVPRVREWRSITLSIINMMMMYFVRTGWSVIPLTCVLCIRPGSRRPGCW